MFSVVESVNNLPSDATENTLIFVSMSNAIYIFENNEWHKYEDYIGFEEVASVILNDDFSSSEEALVFSDTPFYDSFKLDNLYYVLFSCDKLSSFNSVDNYDFSIIKNDETIIFSSSNMISYNPLFKVYFSINQELSAEATSNPIREFAFNVNTNNIIINNPITLSVFKSLREV
jgi:hypothetical protein